MSIENQIIVKYEFRSKRDFHCHLCDRVMQYRVSRQLSIKDSPYKEPDPKQDESLNALLKENAPLNEAYILKEQARAFLKMRDFNDAALCFGKWIEPASNSSLAPLRRIAKTLARNAPCVLHYFRFRLSSGRIEGFNSMPSRILFHARGLPSIEYLWLKIRERTSPAFSRLI